MKNLAITANPDLGEIHFGEWQGKSFAEIETHEWWEPIQRLPQRDARARRRTDARNTGANRTRSPSDRGFASRPDGSRFQPCRRDQGRVDALSRYSARLPPAPRNSPGLNHHRGIRAALSGGAQRSTFANRSTFTVSRFEGSTISAPAGGWKRDASGSEREIFVSFIGGVAGPRIRSLSHYLHPEISRHPSLVGARDRSVVSNGADRPGGCRFSFLPQANHLWFANRGFRSIFPARALAVVNQRRSCGRLFARQILAGSVCMEPVAFLSCEPASDHRACGERCRHWKSNYNDIRRQDPQFR